MDVSSAARVVSKCVGDPSDYDEIVAFVETHCRPVFSTDGKFQQEDADVPCAIAEGMQGINDLGRHAARSRSRCHRAGAGKAPGLAAMEIAEIAEIAFVDMRLADGVTGPEIGAALHARGVTLVFTTGNQRSFWTVRLELGSLLSAMMRLRSAIAFATACRKGRTVPPPPRLIRIPDCQVSGWPLAACTKRVNALKSRFAKIGALAWPMDGDRHGRKIVGRTNLAAQRRAIDLKSAALHVKAGCVRCNHLVGSSSPR